MCFEELSRFFNLSRKAVASSPNTMRPVQGTTVTPSTCRVVMSKLIIGLRCMPDQCPQAYLRGSQNATAAAQSVLPQLSFSAGQCRDCKTCQRNGERGVKR